MTRLYVHVFALRSTVLLSVKNLTLLIQLLIVDALLKTSWLKFKTMVLVKTANLEHLMTQITARNKAYQPISRGVKTFVPV